MKKSNINTTNVLYQKLGNTWYVFADVGSETLFTALPNGIDPTTKDFELFQVIDDNISSRERTHETFQEVA